MNLANSVKIGQLFITLGLVIIPDRILANMYSFDRTTSSNCDDVAIVGAGIAGTYAAWKLRNTNQKITIYEYSNRIGGRFYTTYFAEAPDIKIDLGAMRFKPSLHVRLNRTIHDLGLKAIPFDLGSGPYPDTLMYLRGSHLRYKQLGTRKMPYSLGPYGNLSPDQLKWELYANHTDILTDKNASIFKVRSADGVPIHRQSAQVFLSKYVNSETFEFLKQIDGFDFFFGDLSAAITLPWPEPGPDAKTEVVETVDGGMIRIPETLLRQFLQQSSRHSIEMNKHLTAIKKRKDGTYMLSFELTRTTNGNTKRTNKVERKCAKKIILATNRMSLEQLDWSALKQPYFKDIISNAVQDFLAAKIFLAYSEPWWRQTGVDFDYAISDTLLRQTYDFGTSKWSNVSVLNAGYMDDITVSLWNEMQKRDNENAELFVSNEMMTAINRILAKIYNTSVANIPAPLGGAAQMWNYYPFGGAWQKLMPGYDWSKIEYTMIKPSPIDDVYVATNAFNGRAKSYWSEAALETVDLVLQHFKTAQ